MNSTNNRCRVAIVGAGAGGLVVCHRLTHTPAKLPSESRHESRSMEVTVFEQSGNIGGTWIYTDQTGTDDNGLPIHSSMYKSLKTNLAKEAMPYLDFPFPEPGPSFIPHEQVLQYLNNYCDEKDIRKCIQFNVKVNKVWPVQKPGSTETYWHVETEGVLDKMSRVHEFDAIAVCNGHYYIPLYPELPGLDTIRMSMHSHDYREAKPFTKKRVVCLGAGPSGWDIAIDISKVAEQVFLCSKEHLLCPFPKNVRLAPWPVSCDVNRITFPDGDVIENVDAVVLCTGYKYDFPFLVEDPQSNRPLVRVDDGRVSPLYEHLFHIRYPSLALFGVPKSVLPFCLMDVQSQVFRRILDGTVLLPSSDIMESEERRKLQMALDEGVPIRHFHKMTPETMRVYVENLADFGKIDDRVPPAVHKLFAVAIPTIKRLGLEEYRKVNYGRTYDDFFLRYPIDDSQPLE